MNALHHPSTTTGRDAPLMNAALKFLSFASRPAYWMMAVGLVFAATHGPVFAQPAPDLPEGIDPDPDRPDPDAPPFFEKTGEQVDCDYVVYRLRFGARGNPAKFLDPDFIAEMPQVRIDISDTLPAGLEIVDVQVAGDGTVADGGPLPVPTISTTTNPNDTMTLDDFRVSTSDLDGSGEIDRRYVDFIITARIDHAAFPAPAIVANQGFATVTRIEGIVVEVPSHNPALPDDGAIETGDPTDVAIDVSRCDRPPPPPPPGEECFKVERGDVDCVPGGGALIYNMPVGPELSGKWVQLRTTTPGVTVAPLSQFVPIGGGVLNWTITGALPGDVVHLIVTGIEAYGGPEEGIGICCTQVIDIVVPPDLECPPEGEPDIQVEKKADVRRCTPAGGCDFTITVTNVGDAPYNGPIVLEDVTAPGAAPVVSGPNPPWACPPMVSPMVCTHPATTLDPGESVELTLGFAPGPGWDWNFIRNCAEYDYTASGFPEVFGSTENDKACATIPICRRGDPRCDPPEKRVDLRITKDPRSLECSADGVCKFVIRVYNNGAQTYDGPLTVIDEYPTGEPASSEFEPTPPWVCGPIGGGQFQCDLADISLVPNAWAAITVRAVVPQDYPGDTIQNCAEVKAIPEETNLANNRACADMRIPGRNTGRPELRIEKTCQEPSDIGSPATCRITIRNDGSVAPTGPVRVHDAAEVIGGGTPVQILSVTPDGAEWACGPVPANTLSCQIPGAVMTPGASRHFDVTLQAPSYGRFENCARGNWGPAPGNDIVYPFGEACAEGGSLPEPVHVEKTGDRQCRLGEPCTFEITITNGGTQAFSGPVRISDAISAGGTPLDGVAITEIVPPLGCSPEPATLPVSCVATMTLDPGESRVHQVTLVIPKSGALGNIREPVTGRNCIGIAPPDTSAADAEAMMSKAPETSGRPGTQPSACHVFSIANPVAECSPGFVMNDAGRCVCPEGTSFRNGQCRASGAGTQPPPAPPPSPPPVRACKLLPGQIRTESGRCVCPRGTELRAGGCVKIDRPVIQCQLLPGQIRTQDGRCICPRGTSLVRGQCRRDLPPQCKLLPGQIRTQDGRCICPRGTSLVRGQCRRDLPPQCKLLPGQIRTQDGRCICPRGTRLVNGECRQRQVECPKGTQLVRGRCVQADPVCRRGQVLRNGKCFDIQKPRILLEPRKGTGQQDGNAPN